MGCVDESLGSSSVIKSVVAQSVEGQTFEIHVFTIEIHFRTTTGVDRAVHHDNRTVLKELGEPISDILDFKWMYMTDIRVLFP